MPTPVDSFLDLGDFRLHYLDWGNAEATPLVLLHGFSSSAHGWDDVAPALAESFHVLAMDFRGHGESDWHEDADYSTSRCVADLAAFVDTLQLRSFRLCGHSMGGGISLVYTARHPGVVERLILEDSGARMASRNGDVRGFFQSYATRPMYFDSRAEAEAWLKPTIATAFANRTIGYGLVELPDGRVTWRADVQGLIRSRQRGADTSVSEGFWEEIEQIHCPTLVIKGEKASSISWEAAAEMQRRNPLISTVQVDGASHWVHYDDPDAFVRLAREFLTQGLPARQT